MCGRCPLEPENPGGKVELVKILRELSRRKVMVAVVLAIALIAGLLLAFKPGVPPKSRQYTVSLSSADILVDTNDSQVAAVSGRGPDLPTLASRANLIGNLMTGGPLKEAIAEAANVPAGKLVVVPPSNPLTPNVPSAPVKPPESREISDADSTILSLSTDASLPILHIEAQAPSPEQARELTLAAVEQVKEYVGTVVAAQNVPLAHQLVIRELGAPVAETATRGLPRRYAIFAFLGILLVGCTAILIGAWFKRSWKAIEAEEGRAGDGVLAANANGNGNGNGKAHGSGDELDADGVPVPDLPPSQLVRFPL
jgi:capsular polysaccharide biosynthesis protein